MNLYRKKIFIIVSLVAFGLFGCLTSVKALTISPPLIDSEANPGSIIQGTIKLTNDTPEKAQFFSSINRFEAKGEKGEPQIIEEGERIGLVNWIQITPGPVELSPGETQQVPFTINVPKDAEPGGHYAAIFWGAKPLKVEGAEATRVAIEYKVGTLVLLAVSGKITEEGQIIEFDTTKKHFFSHLPVEFFVRFQNTGTIHIIPQGEINIKNIFDREIAKVLVNEKGGSVLPNSIRRFEAVWSKKGAPALSTGGFFSGLKNEWNNFAFGRYKADLDLIYGYESTKMLSANLAFWVIPWRISITVIVILVILILIAKVGVGKYNRRIIRKYREKEQQG